MAIVNRLGVISFARFQAKLMALVGIFAGAVYAIGGAIYDLLTIGLNVGTALALFALVGMPIVFAAIGFLIGLIEAVLYNAIAQWFPRIRIDFED